jgi:MFS family permease
MTPGESLPPDDGSGLWSAPRRGLTVGLVLTITLVAFEALAVSTIMPVIAGELGTLELYGWVFSAFFLGSLIGIVVVGGIIDRRGLGLPFALGLGLFAIGLIAGGLAPSMAVLVVARFIQGLGAGSISPIAYVAIARSLPERLRPRMFATLSTAWVLPGVIGPAIAGIVADRVGWRVVFLGLLPLIAVAGTLTFPSVRGVVAARVADVSASSTAALSRRLPLAILVALGTGLVTVALEMTDPRLVAIVGLPGLLLGIFALRRLTPAGTLRAARGLPAAVLVRGIATFAFFGVDAYVALSLVTWRGLSATEAGISLTAATLSWTAGSWIQAHGSSRWGPERFVRVGLAVVIVGLALFGLVLEPSVPVWLAVPTFAIAGLGMGLAYAPLSLIVLREAPAGEQGAASSALSLTDALGTALGTGVTGAMVAVAVRSSGEPATGLAAGFAIAIAVGALGFLLSGRLHVAAEHRGARAVPESGVGRTGPSGEAAQG